MQITWLKKKENQLTTPTPQVSASPSHSIRLTISLLTFGSFEHSMRLLPDLCERVANGGGLLDDLEVTIILRNNNLRLDSSEFDQIWRDLEQRYGKVRFMLFNDGFNVGYGGGHNRNLDASNSDYFLILNDDTAFWDFDWLKTALAILDNNPDVGAVGASTNPGSITPVYANGAHSREWHRWRLRYVEGSVALFRTSVLNEVGKFDPAYEWALCEDTDLSFRIQALGYRLEWIDIPHEHWRASSFNTLPESVKGAILEHNRSVFFSKWNIAIEQGRIGRVQIYDLWSDGIGDVFIACLHLGVHLRTLTGAQRSSVIVNTSMPDLARQLLGDEIVVSSIPDHHRLLASHAQAGVRSLNSLRGINYSLPFNIHAAICGALGLPVCGTEELAGVLRERRRVPDVNIRSPLPLEPYCVMHLESERADHDGKAPSPETTALIATVAAEFFPNIVLVGRNKHISFDHLADTTRVTDLRGCLSFSTLFDTIAGADIFVGLDSFPAHAAQVLGVRSILYFGSNHPSFRVLSMGLTWPLLRPLPCIGCYHTLLEPGIPFCMRRDLACTKDFSEIEIRSVMRSCQNLEAFDWRILEVRALELQRQFLLKMFYHPSPPRRFLNVEGTPQLPTTSLIEGIIEQIRGHVLNQEGLGSLSGSVEMLEDTKRELHLKDVQIQSMTKLIAGLRAQLGGS